MISVALILVILGILIKYGKMYFLIAGYNTMPKEEKEKYDIEAIATTFRNAMFGMALLILIGYTISKLTDLTKAQDYFFWAALIIGIPYLLIASNLKKHQKKE